MKIPSPARRFRRISTRWPTTCTSSRRLWSTTCASASPASCWTTLGRARQPAWTLGNKLGVPNSNTNPQQSMLPDLLARQLHGHRAEPLAADFPPRKYLPGHGRRHLDARQAHHQIRRRYPPPPDHRVSDQPRQRPLQLQHRIHGHAGRGRIGQLHGQLCARLRDADRTGFHAGLAGHPRHRKRSLRRRRLARHQEAHAQSRVALGILQPLQRGRQPLVQFRRRHRHHSGRRTEWREQHRRRAARTGRISRRASASPTS